MHNCLKLMYQTRFTQITWTPSGPDYPERRKRTTKFRARKPQGVRQKTFSRLAAAGYLADVFNYARITSTATITAKGRGYAKRYWFPGL